MQKTVGFIFYKKKKDKKRKKQEKRKPLIQHIKELRQATIGSIIAIIVSAVVCYGFFRKPLMEFFIRPLMYGEAPIIYTHVSESFTTEMKVALIAGALMASPIVFLFLWRFVSPALFPKERKRTIVYTVVAVALFTSGICFCYWIIVPFTLYFFLTQESVEMEAMLTISGYIEFICKLFIPFGLVFETPLAIYLLAKASVVPIKRIKKIRKIVLLICFLLAAIITPPDVVSQLLVAVPMYLMYELGMLLGKLSEIRRNRREKRMCAQGMHVERSM